MSNFDLRTHEAKIADKIHVNIDRDLSVLNGTYIPVLYYTTVLGKDLHTHYPTDSEHWFAEPGLGIIHCFVYDDKGNRTRPWVQNVREVNKIYFKIG